MSNKFVTADHHFFHEGIISHCNRPFTKFNDRGEIVPDVPSMNQTMLERWNSVVRPNDIVYYLGDMFYKGHTKDCEGIVDQLNGQIYFVRGNHDQVAKKFKHRFLSWGDMLEVKQDGQLLVLCHYALRVWNKSHVGSYHVYGHSHGQLPEDPNSLSFDIGVDCWNFFPVSLDEVFQKMKQKESARGENRLETRPQDQARTAD